jgi:hypothetical protein
MRHASTEVSIGRPSVNWNRRPTTDERSER